MESQTLSVEVNAQIAIVGGGIAGLWLLSRLNQAGYDAILLTNSDLGTGQTLASQGIIHGGLKYALNGVLSPASSAIADMPARWRACLEGEGEVDLQGCAVLSPHFYMWSSGSYRSRLKTFLGSKALRGRIDALSAGMYPEFFRRTANHKPGGTLYQLTDFVVDTPSLIDTLTAPWRDRLFRCDDIQLTGDDNSTLAVTAAGETTTIKTSRVVLCAGEGNEALLSAATIATAAAFPAMQRRALHMVTVRVSHPAPVYVHCIGDSLGMTPRITLTSHPCRSSENDGDSEWIWYLGGELAESGTQRNAQEQQAFARKELETLFPWVNLEDARWNSFFINRAEPRVSNMQRPDNAYVEACGNVLVCWPTKLTLCPNLGDLVLDKLEADSPLNAEDPRPMLKTLNARLPTPAIAASPWEDMR